MRPAILFLLLALAAGVLAGSPPAHASVLLVAGVQVTAPAESLRVRDVRVRASEHLTPQASPFRAMTLSTLSTVVPIGVGLTIGDRGGNEVAGAALIVGGVIVGPAVGYFDSGLHRRGMRGVMLRTATGILALSAVSALIANDSDLTDVSGPVFLFLGGVGATALLAVADCVLVGRDVAHARSVSFAPAIVPLGRTAAVGVTMRF